jgi:hypothetical protein
MAGPRGAGSKERCLSGGKHFAPVADAEFEAFVKALKTQG